MNVDLQGWQVYDHNVWDNTSSSDGGGDSHSCPLIRNRKRQHEENCDDRGSQSSGKNNFVKVSSSKGKGENDKKHRVPDSCKGGQDTGARRPEVRSTTSEAITELCIFPKDKLESFYDCEFDWNRVRMAKTHSIKCFGPFAVIEDPEILFNLHRGGVFFDEPHAQAFYTFGCDMHGKHEHGKSLSVEDIERFARCARAAVHPDRLLRRLCDGSPLPRNLVQMGSESKEESFKRMIKEVQGMYEGSLDIIQAWHTGVMEKIKATPQSSFEEIQAANQAQWLLTVQEQIDRWNE